MHAGTLLLLLRAGQRRGGQRRTGQRIYYFKSVQLACYLGLAWFGSSLVLSICLPAAALM